MTSKPETTKVGAGIFPDCPDGFDVRPHKMPNAAVVRAAAKNYCTGQGDPCACRGEPAAPCLRDAAGWVVAVMAALKEYPDV